VLRTPPATRVLAAAVSGVTTAAHYASPDLVRSRAARGWLKAGLSAAAAAASYPEFRRARAEAEVARAERGDPALGEVLEAVPPRGRVLGAALGASALAASVAGVVVVERWLFRRGEARAAAGVRFAHTRTAVVLGVLAAAVTLLPDADDVVGSGDAAAGPARDA